MSHKSSAGAEPVSAIPRRQKSDALNQDLRAWVSFAGNINLRSVDP
jgi:hypothetical protein